jgi:hypothetical protein
MGRLHLFEFEDQPWFPSWLRNIGTDFLQFLSNKTKMYEPIIPLIEQGMKDARSSDIVDLGSGGGGGLIWINQQLKKRHSNLTIHLTDLFPNLEAFRYTQTIAENFDFHETPIDARQVPKELRGLRTQFLSFHHFKPADAKSILQNAVDAKQPILIVEAQERSIPSLLAMIFSPITLLITTPFIRPFKWTRLLFTYLIPIAPLFVLWDGIVSSLRTYSISEMRELVRDINQSESYNWQIEKIKSGPGVLLYLFGSAKK